MFITDQNGHLIAADDTELLKWGVADIYEAARAFAQGTLRVDEEALTLRDGQTLFYESESLQSLYGTWQLFRVVPEEDLSIESSATSTGILTPSPENMTDIENPEAENIRSEKATSTPMEIKEEAGEDLEALLNLLPEEETLTEESTQTAEEVHNTEDEELLQLLEEIPTEEEASLPEEPQELVTEEEEESPLLLLPEEEEVSTAPQETPVEPQPSKEEVESFSGSEPPAIEEKEDEEALLQLLGEETTSLELEAKSPKPTTDEEESLPTLPLSETTELEEITKEFHPDIEANASRLNLKSDEYRELIRDLIQDIEQRRPQLSSDNPQERQEAISILKDAILLLQLAPLEQLLTSLERAGAEKSPLIIDTLIQLLTSLVEHPTQTTEVEVVESVQESGEEVPLPAETSPQHPEAPVAKSPESVEEAHETPKTQSSIDEFLKGVKPIPISFSLHVAAEELSLPEDLVQEFVTDFANQGREYLPVLIDAYEQKDLDRLQKTAHMLKGAASNLRVEAMVENLYELQFDNDIERAPDRIRKFAGQLMSLENFLKQLNG